MQIGCCLLATLLALVNGSSSSHIQISFSMKQKYLSSLLDSKSNFKHRALSSAHKMYIRDHTQGSSIKVHYVKQLKSSINWDPFKSDDKTDATIADQYAGKAVEHSTLSAAQAKAVARASQSKNAMK